MRTRLATLARGGCCTHFEERVDRGDVRTVATQDRVPGTVARVWREQDQPRAVSQLSERSDPRPRVRACAVEEDDERPSPGFIPPGPRRGRPVVYVSHGVGDSVLPIARCSRRIVPSLRRAGYDVDYREFSGGHNVPPDVARAALEWLSPGISEQPRAASR